MLETIILTVKLAGIVTFLLLLLGLPLAWWLANTGSWIKAPLTALVAMPLVLPPTVLGFYFLLFFGQNSVIFPVVNKLGILPFTFNGLVFASMIYSLPFVVQPLKSTFEIMGKRSSEVAQTLGAGWLKRYFMVVLPQAKNGIITSAVLGFAHTVGEFGVVLMMGGNIPGETRLVSIAIYEYVEILEYGRAHMLSLFMVLFSFMVLWLVYALQKRQKNA